MKDGLSIHPESALTHTEDCFDTGEIGDSNLNVCFFVERRTVIDWLALLKDTANGINRRLAGVRNNAV